MRHIFTYLCLLIFGSFSIAEEVNPITQYLPDIDCTDWDAGSQGTMNICSRYAYAEADAELNEAWTVVKPAIDQWAAENNELYDTDEYADWPVALLEAQRAWIKYRDNHCEVRYLRARPGSIAPLAYNLCLIAMTEERTRELLSLVDFN